MARPSKFTTRQKTKIRKLAESGMKQKDIAKLYNVTPPAIRYILNPDALKRNNAKKKYDTKLNTEAIRKHRAKKRVELFLPTQESDSEAHPI